MKVRIIYLSLLCVAVSFSCKKEDNFTIETTPSLLLSQINIDNIPSYEYTYNSLKLVTEEKNKFAYSVNHYNEKNLLVTTDYYANSDILSSDPKVSEAAMSQKNWVTATKSNLSGSVSYEYNIRDQLIKTIYTPSSGTLQSSQLSYDDNNRINRQNLYWGDTQVGYIDYLYNAEGNLSEETLYNTTASGGTELSTTSEYEYDNKQNPFKLVSKLAIPGICTNLNNIIKVTQTIHQAAAQGGDIVETASYSYKYNVNGYPASKNGNVEYVYI